MSTGTRTKQYVAVPAHGPVIEVILGWFGRSTYHVLAASAADCYQPCIVESHASRAAAERRAWLMRRGSALLDWFIRSRYFEGWQDSTCSSWRDGSTHGEIIDDWRSAWRDCYRDRQADTYLDRVDAAMDAAIEAVEVFHAQQGTLEQEIG